MVSQPAMSYSQLDDYHFVIFFESLMFNMKIPCWDQPNFTRLCWTILLSIYQILPASWTFNCICQHTFRKGTFLPTMVPQSYTKSLRHWRSRETGVQCNFEWRWTWQKNMSVKESNSWYTEVRIENLAHQLQSPLYKHYFSTATLFIKTHTYLQ